MDCIFFVDTIGSVTLVITNLATGNNWVYFGKKDISSRIWFIIYDFLMAHEWQKKTLDTLIFLWQLYGYVSPIKNMEATSLLHSWSSHFAVCCQKMYWVCSAQQYCITLWTSNHSVIQNSFYINVRFKRQVMFVIGPLNWHDTLRYEWSQH